MTAFPLSSASVPDLIELDSTSSTNSELSARAAESELAAFTTVVTSDQTAGRGRLGRAWVAPAGSSLAISVLVRPPAATSADRFGWLAIGAGVAMVEAVRSVLPDVMIGFKWPNDVLVAGRKVSGILSELLPDGSVVVGAGLNVSISTSQLPVPTATSLMIAGAGGDALADRVLARYLTGFRRIVDELWKADADADRSGLRAAAAARCTTLGTEVRVDLPADHELRGTAVDLDADGRLVIRRTDGGLQHVAAGDVTHLR